ncbi:MAG: caspase family protein [Proteobacteria bacterium]|nr:caspase family protein [Pseudomonadota bacterium]
MYVIEERGKSTSGKIYKGRRWYQPDAGIVIKAERDWVKSFQVRPMMADAGGFGGPPLGGLGGGFGGGFGGFGPSSMCMGTEYVKEPLFGEGEEDNYSLVRVTYPEGTTTHALKGTKEGGQAEALLAQVRGLKKEIEVVSRGLTGKPVIDIKGIEFGDYHALIIGIDKYKYLPKLGTAVRDAKAVAQVLEKDYGFKVRLLVNPDRVAIIDALDEYRESLGGKDNLLIYYAGHGWLDKDADRGYWLPADAQTNRRSRWVSNATITDTLMTLQAKHVMVVADSCYSGTLTRSANIGLRAGDYYKRMAEKWTRVALVSGGLEPVADKGGGGHSPFAKAFLDVLRGNDSIIDGTELFTKMRCPVMVSTDQTPEYSDVRNAGHDGGDFLFVKKK